MLRILPYLLVSACLVLPVRSLAVDHQLRNATTTAAFGPDGLLSVEDTGSHSKIDIARDAWLMVIDGVTLNSTGTKPTIHETANSEITYDYDRQGYRIQIVYRMKRDWRFVDKQISVLRAPNDRFTVHRIVPWDIDVSSTVVSDYTPSTYVPQFGESIEQSRASLPGKDFGEFLRLAGEEGALLVVQNPYLEVRRDRQSVTVSYAPEIEWRQAWGSFASDTACIGTYRLSGRRKSREMVREWHPAPTQSAEDGMDDAEVAAFTGCVRAYLIDPPQEPTTVEVGWTLNDYQIDVGTEDGKTEYKRIIDVASELGIKTILYAPGNSTLADRKQSADSWSWEYVLWLNLGEKIRKSEWNPAKDPIPASVSEMLSYAQQKHVGLLAYVYPSVPYTANSTWLVKRPEKQEAPYTYATLASRELQDYLIDNLVAFQKRTGIAGYSFDYTWLNLPGSSSYAQWYGWRRVMETLRKSDPAIIIDGRQSYQMYGPWSWLAGSYPHPTGNDEQPESFKPYPDLHFDRVSADRTRYVNYWYRNYQFAPEEIIPGYATHQTERSRSVPNTEGRGPSGEMMYARYRPRDWDYLGYQYSFLSSIATGGWNNVVDMIPARDPEEAKHFSEEDKAWIRSWLAWTTKNKEYLLHTRTILEQPALGHVDGTAAILGDRGYLFLFNPNYKELSAGFTLDETIGLARSAKGNKFLLREIYPQEGRLLGKPGAGAWSSGDRVSLMLDGTSATVFEMVPEGNVEQPILVNTAALHAAVPPSVEMKGSALSVVHAAGEPGTAQKLGVLLPENSKVTSMTVNGASVKFMQSGSYVETQSQFQGIRFAQAQEVKIEPGVDGSLTGTFVVPRRVLDQLAARKLKWPIPWTQEDYESTWLAPERLLLFVQFVDGNNSMNVTGMLDGQVLKLQPAYSSSRVHAASFVGFYADLSQIAPDVRHTMELQMLRTARDQLQGVFFDNVVPQLTESLAP